MKKLIAIAAAGTLVFAACGGSDGGSGDDAKDRLFNELMASMNEGDDAIPEDALDEDCVRSAIDEIPDDQAAILADNIDSPDIPEGVDEDAVIAMSSALFECVDFGSLIEE